jgi:hypothetical protein
MSQSAFEKWFFHNTSFLIRKEGPKIWAKLCRMAHPGKISQNQKYFHRNGQYTGTTARIGKRTSYLDFPAHFMSNWDMMSKIPDLLLCNYAPLCRLPLSEFESATSVTWLVMFIITVYHCHYCYRGLKPRTILWNSTLPGPYVTVCISLLAIPFILLLLPSSRAVPFVLSL